MTTTGVLTRCLITAALVSIVGSARVGAQLFVNGDFEATPNSASLRRDDKGQDWYESRVDTKEGRRHLLLSTKKVADNPSKKAMIKAHPELNTYLTQRFSEPQTADFSVQLRICVREILPDDNRSAFILIGSDRDKNRGPNSTGRERFVFLGFENAREQGRINLFARERESNWSDKTIVAENLEVGKWYTVDIVVYTDAESYEVTVKDVTGPVELDAFGPKGKAPKKLTHLSFASWNDGAGTFYVDDVAGRKE